MRGIFPQTVEACPYYAWTLNPLLRSLSKGYCPVIRMMNVVLRLNRWCRYQEYVSTSVVWMETFSGVNGNVHWGQAKGLPDWNNQGIVWLLCLKVRPCKGDVCPSVRFRKNRLRMGKAFLCVTWSVPRGTSIPPCPFSTAFKGSKVIKAKMPPTCTRTVRL